MTVTLRYGDLEVSRGLPVSAMNLQDILDRMNVQSGREIEYEFSNYDMADLPADFLDKWYKADIYKLNVFVEQFERLEKHEKAGFKLLQNRLKLLPQPKMKRQAKRIPKRAEVQNRHKKQ